MLNIKPLEILRDINQTSFIKIDSLIYNNAIKTVVKEYKAHNAQSVETGLNLFTLISDQYKKENLHSDIISEILLIEGQHGEQDKFLKLFIAYLNRQTAIRLHFDDYKNAKIDREGGRIDISILDSVSGKAIIIENKINGAGDMPRQIPRYVEHVEKQGYNVEAIVYLNLGYCTTPDVVGWTAEERKTIYNKLISICAYNEKDLDLYNGWLTQCEVNAERIDSLFLLKQYKALIKKIGKIDMNKPLMESFLQNMLKDDNYETAFALKEMLDALRFYRISRIVDTYIYNYKPFTRLGPYGGGLVVFDRLYTKKNEEFAIDIAVEDKAYRFQFFERKYNEKDVENVLNPAITTLSNMGLISQFSPTGSRMEIIFKFPEQERDLYDFIDEFLKALVTEFINLV